MKRLLNGCEMPSMGYGLYQIPPSQAKAATLRALAVGYRHFDSASFYGNEREVGEALKESGIPRSELFIATKVWTDCFHRARQSILKSLQLLQLDYVDLAYVHWPAPGHQQAYKQLETLFPHQIKGLGLSNYRIQDYFDTEVPPLVNQIEVNPWMYRRETIDFFEKKGIAIVAYKPLLRGAFTGLQSIAEKHNVSEALVLLKWGLNKGFTVIPKSLSHMEENLQAPSCPLDDDDMAYLDSFPTDYAAFEAHFQKRCINDPAQPTLAEYGGA